MYHRGACPAPAARPPPGPRCGILAAIASPPPRPAGGEPLGARVLVAAGWSLLALAVALHLLLPGTRSLSWDVAERAHLLDRLRADGGLLADPLARWFFLFFAHVLEMPLAWLVQAASGVSGLAALRALSIGSAVALLAVLGRVVARRARDGWAAAWAVAMLAVSAGFWVFATRGEERVLGSLPIALCLALLWGGAGEGRTRSALLAGCLALALWTHLWAAALFPFLLLSAALGGAFAAWGRWRRRLAILGGGALLGGAGLALAAAVAAGAASPAEVWGWLAYYHSAEGMSYLAVDLLQIEGPLGEAALGMARLVSFRPAAGLAVAGCVVAAALLAARGRRPRAPEVRDALLFSLVWSAHFLFFEPANPESWLPLWWCWLAAGAVALASGGAPGVGRTAMALLLAGLVVANADGFRRERQQQTPERALAAALAATVERPAAVLTGGGLVREGGRDRHLPGAGRLRLLQVLVPADVELKALPELLRPERTDVVGLPRESLETFLARQRRQGRTLYFLDDVLPLVERLGWVGHRRVARLPGAELYRGGSMAAAEPPPRER